MSVPRKSLNSMRARAEELLRRADGPLTHDLVQTPGRFGLGRVPEALAPQATATSVCGFCSTGCNLQMHLRGSAAVNLSPDARYPVNLGMACPKGWEALTPLRAPDRATHPLLRDTAGKLRRVSWDEALRTFTARFKSIQEKDGPDSVAWLGSGQITSEELAFLGSLAKFGMGIRHGDGNTRQCMATAVAAYKQSFGFDAPPYTYEDFEQSDVIVLVGSNLCITHPILWQRILLNRHHPEIIVIDPRATETALSATQHYAIQPKSDLLLFYAIAAYLIEENYLDRAFMREHTSGFEAFQQHVQSFSRADVLNTAGLSLAQFHRLAYTIGKGKRVSFWWTMGVNQGHEATRTAQAIINLALLTGNIGRPGAGANSITGQCNAMGSRLFSNTTNLIGGHDFLNPVHREKVSRILDIPLEKIPSQNSLAYDQIMDGIEAGRIKGLWVIGTNGAHSWIEQKRARLTLDKLEFMVVQDMFHNTETAQHAHLVLPAAGWGEKEGTFINSERRFGVIRKVAVAPGEALADFQIFKAVAAYWGCADLFARWTSPEAVFKILAEISAGQPCDISGISGYDALQTAGGIQWPYPPGSSLGGNQRRLFEDGQFFHADGKARFIFAEPQAVPEPSDREFPFVLLTGRGSSAQWHTQTRTGKSHVLRKLYSEQIYVELNTTDAASLGVTSGARLEVRSRRGALVARARVTSTIAPGQIFIPMHYPEVNQLTLQVVDSESRQPAYKHCAVALRRVK